MIHLMRTTHAHSHATLYIYLYVRQCQQNIYIHEPFESLTYLRVEMLKLNNSLHNHINKNKHMFVGAMNIHADPIRARRCDNTHVDDAKWE